MRRSIWNKLFLISTFGLGLMAGVLVWKEMTPEWLPIQAEYYRRLAEVTQDPSRAKGPLKVQQIYLPQFHRTDRCTTCHLGVENPRMVDQPQPFAAHPDLGVEGFLQAHNFSEIGCTICHQGQGPATTMEAAHGHVKHWEEPLLEKGMTVANCAVCHADVFGLPGAEVLAEAKVLFEEKGCIGCHALNGVGNQIGPELSDTAKKSLDELDFRHVRGAHTVANWIEDHFRDPQRVVPEDKAMGIPESSMPNYEFTEEETKKLTALVLSFAAAKGDEKHPIPARFQVAAVSQPVAAPLPLTTSEQGRVFFQQYGCVGCHGPEGRGGIRNKNMYPGEEVPPLVYVSEGFTKEELKEVIQKGRYPARASSEGMPPPLWMPAWEKKIPEEEIEAIVEYLYTLHPDRPATQTQQAKEATP
ncbi:MAG: cytochrome c [Candidatus Omnitrophica bacterium]|nr:cytochrome c [Candidatus Omnitrophota bacterium]